MHGDRKDHQISKAILRKKTKLEESGFLTSDYTIKLQSSKQYGTGTKKRNTGQWNKIQTPEIDP